MKKNSAYKTFTHSNSVANIHPILFKSAPQNNHLSMFFTTKPIGDKPSTFSIEETYDFLAKQLQIKKEKIIYLNQTHSSNIETIDNQISDLPIPNTDGIITQQKNICLCIRTADCSPILLYDSETKTIGALHAGWKGTAANITGNAVDIMVEKYHCNPKNIQAFIGPCITQPAYEVGQEVFDAFQNLGIASQTVFKPGIKPGKYYCDIKIANKLILSKKGLDERNIEISQHCTFSEPELFYSARRDGIETGRIITGIMLQD